MNVKPPGPQAPVTQGLQQSAVALALAQTLVVTTLIIALNSVVTLISFSWLRAAGDATTSVVIRQAGEPAVWRLFSLGLAVCLLALCQRGSRATALIEFVVFAGWVTLLFGVVEIVAEFVLSVHLSSHHFSLNKWVAGNSFRTYAVVVLGGIALVLIGQLLRRRTATGQAEARSPYTWSVTTAAATVLGFGLGVAYLFHHGRDHDFVRYEALPAVAMCVCLVLVGALRQRDRRSLLAIVGCAAAGLAGMQASVLWPGDPRGASSEGSDLLFLGALVVSAVTFYFADAVQPKASKSSDKDDYQPAPV